MKKYPFLEAIGTADEKFLEEVFEDTRQKRRIHMSSIKIIAAAACAALVIGAGMFALGSQTELPTEPPKDPQPGTEINLPVQTKPVTDADAVEVERSYNERIADGEDVDIETYIGKEFNIGWYTFILRNVNISLTLPEGITVDDLYGPISSVTNYGEDGWDCGLGDNYGEEGWDRNAYGSFRDYLDDEGRYDGPTNEGYRWIFITMDITNNSDEERTEGSSIHLCGGNYISGTWPYTGIDEDTGEEYTIIQAAEYYQYEQQTCYMSEHTDKESYDGQADVKKLTNIHFEPYETKTLVFGFAVSDHFVYDDLYIRLTLLNPELWNDDQYIPLK